MKNIILKNGIFAGLIVTAFMLYGTISLQKNPKDFEPSYVLGFTGMILAFTFIFIGIKQFRDKINDGYVTFGQGFKVGFLIALFASAIYVGVWLIEYYFFFPDFMERYAEFELSHAKPEELAEKTKEMASYKEWYKNPILIILLTFMEILPLGLLITLISALILKRKKTIEL